MCCRYKVVLKALLAQIFISLAVGNGLAMNAPASDSNLISQEVDKLVRSGGCAGAQPDVLEALLRPLGFSMTSGALLQQDKACSRRYPSNEHISKPDPVGLFCSMGLDNLKKACSIIKSHPGSLVSMESLIQPLKATTLNEVCKVLSEWIASSKTAHKQARQLYVDRCPQTCSQEAANGPTQASKDCYALYCSRKVLNALEGQYLGKTGSAPVGAPSVPVSPAAEAAPDAGRQLGLPPTPPGSLVPVSSDNVGLRGAHQNLKLFQNPRLGARPLAGAASEADQTGPAAEKPGSTGDKTGLPADTVQSDADAMGSVVRKTKPVPGKTIAAAEHKGQGGDGTEMSAGQTGPTGDQTGATGDQTGATGGQTGATGGQTGPTGGQTGATGGQTGPTGGQMGPEGDQTGLTGDEKGPVTESSARTDWGGSSPPGDRPADPSHTPKAPKRPTQKPGQALPDRSPKKSSAPPSTSTSAAAAPSSSAVSVAAASAPAPASAAQTPSPAPVPVPEGGGPPPPPPARPTVAAPAGSDQGAEYGGGLDSYESGAGVGGAGGDDDFSINEPRPVYKAPSGVLAADQQPGLGPYMTGALPAQGGDSNFFAYFLTAVVLCVVLYLMFHNKQKILALLIEGRSPAGRRRPHSSQYRRLDNSLEEAISSQQRQDIASSIIY